MVLVDKLGMPKLTRLLTLREDKTYIDATGVILQRVFNALAKMDRQKELKPDPEVAEGTFYFFMADAYWQVCIVRIERNMYNGKVVPNFLSDRLDL